MDFESSGNYLKHVIIFACLDEVNPPLFSKKADWRVPDGDTM